MIAPLLLVMALSGPARVADEVVSNPAPTSEEAPIAEAFRAAQKGDFNAYLLVVHPERRGSPAMEAERKATEWKRFLNQFKWYLTATEPPTFVVTAKDSDGPGLARVFLKDQTHPDRMPVPVRLMLDGTVWKVLVSSL